MPACRCSVLPYDCLQRNQASWVSVAQWPQPRSKDLHMPTLQTGTDRGPVSPLGVPEASSPFKALAGLTPSGAAGQSLFLPLPTPDGSRPPLAVVTALQLLSSLCSSLLSACLYALLSPLPSL